MAFGFPAYHEEEVQTPQPVTYEWIAHACRVAGFSPPSGGAQEARGWTWRASTDFSLASYGEAVAITALGPQHLHVRSECGMPTQCIDWGKNKKNVTTFVSALLAGMAAARPAGP